MYLCDRCDHGILDYKGQGSVKVNNTTVVTTTVDRLILLTTSADDQFLWVRTIDSPLTNDAPAGLTYGDDYQVYTGLTHNSGISITGNPIDNNGGYDIFLLRFDENGDLTGNKVYGTSQEDENVKQLFYNSGILYFGGEFMGPTEERIIGKYRFLNLAGNNSNAYISFVKNESFDDTPVQPLVSAGNSGSNPMHPEFGYDGKNKEQVTTVNIFPSPFSDYLMIDFNITQKSYFNMELYNTIGELIVRKGLWCAAISTG